MNSIVTAPFTPFQVQSLNEYQVSGVFHEFTCGGKSCRCILEANPHGWECPSCGFKQNWAWSWMADWTWEGAKNLLKPLEENPREGDQDS
jgi:putative ribosome biogenesis GTPase RsgA